MKARLILENGKIFEGEAFGASGNVAGEVVFATGMGGYQESLTDPSFAGKIVTMTFPLIGNYGINLEDMESDKTHLTALVVREKCDYPSNFRNEMTLDDFLKQQGVVGIEGIDTRALTRLLRDSGSMKGVIVTEDVTDAEVKKMLDEFDGKSIIKETSTKEKYVVNSSGKYTIALIDLGVKASIIEELTKRNCKVEVFPANTPAEDIMASNPDMVFLSSGPGNPSDIPETVETVKAVLNDVPVCGICTGHLVIGLALGGKIEKLKFGHHGENQPVRDMESGKVYITAQSHDYVVTELPDCVSESFLNVNDGTCEGIAHKTLPILSVQFHPEAAPGPVETKFIFDRFTDLIK